MILSHTESKNLVSRRLSAPVVMGCLMLACLPSAASGQMAGGGSNTPANAPVVITPAVQNMEGRTTANNVFVRSGPGDNYYPVLQLPLGAKIVVTGSYNDWLRIVPPAGAFSLVAKDFVTVTGTSGQIKGSVVNVRAGSTLSGQDSKIQTKLPMGSVVTILGEQDAYYRVSPPGGAYLYIKKDFVQPVGAAGPGDVPPEVAPPVKMSPPGTSTMTPANGLPGVSGMMTTRPSMAVDTTTMPVTPGSVVTPPRTYTLAPPPVRTAAQDAAEQAYDAAEKATNDIKDTPLADQPLESLLGQWRPLAGNEALPATLRNNAQVAVKRLESRLSVQKELVALKQNSSATQQKIATMDAERSRLMSNVTIHVSANYTAVGELQTSTLREDMNRTQLLRLVDPATRDTLVYLRGVTDASMVGRFVGVKGDLVNDGALSTRIVNVTSVTSVDSSMVGRGVVATIAPQSLVSGLVPEVPASTQPVVPVK